MTTITDREHLMMLEADLANARERIAELEAGLLRIRKADTHHRSHGLTGEDHMEWDEYGPAAQIANAMLKKEDTE